MSPSAAPSLSELRERVQQMQGRPAAQPVATHPALSGLLQLQAGSTYSVDSMSLAVALMAGPSADGAWCGVVGTAELGLEAAAAAGVELRRTILVPDPGESWLEVTAALIDVLGVVVLRAPSFVPAKDVSRISARLRQRGGILVAYGDWPRSEARLSMRDVEWVGVGRGHGHLQARRATVEVQRGTAPARRGRLWLPDASQVIRRVEDDAPAPGRLRSVS
ncbi:hypothetical protein [Aeromicrobium chenweiae]|uniref:Uncharacterized protein n=1 Tax=Aeromicrobium chenweiae TaxID=2079793 RepID=A0A2S0WNL1_9ACTN|nr:hypothetical protein [Aeromicrobium chenweiae]AWB92896.1 hypothetical protein C3E78_12160 [Aeromicrobium chenweiae]TGN33890.1 hypothetical protein E4L97_02210 [Aeromicrobium chenweiae]